MCMAEASKRNDRYLARWHAEGVTVTAAVQAGGRLASKPSDNLPRSLQYASPCM